MKNCSYCGRENDDAAAQCRECGTEFPRLESESAPEADPRQEPIPEPEPDPQPEFKPVVINLENVPGAFGFEEGFSRPDWKVIARAIEAGTDALERDAAWREAALQWLEKLREELGGNYRWYQSRRIALLTMINKSEAARMLDFAEKKLTDIRDFLGDTAWAQYHGCHVLIVFDDEDDYYQYISYFHREGEHPRTSGIFITTGGYAHIAVRQMTSSTYGIIAHELVHNCVAHLRIPLWLNEGIAQIFDTQAARVPDSEMIDRHNRFWTEERMQMFWAGTSFKQPGESIALSYSLATIVLRLLAENRDDFRAFIRTARREDAGQDAALNCLGKCLGETVATFLGPGNWRPQRKAIKACWEASEACAGYATG